MDHNEKNILSNKNKNRTVEYENQPQSKLLNLK